MNLLPYHTHYSTRKHALIWLGIWLALLATSIFCRSLLPFHETAIAGTSWLLWQNLETLSDNTPIPTHYFSPLLNALTWLYWYSFGVHEIGLRLVSAALSFSTLLLTALAARQLWPDDNKVRTLAPLILLGSLVWTSMATAHLAIIALSFCIIIFMNACLYAHRTKKCGKILLSISFFFGLASCGISFLMYALPIALALPLRHSNHQYVDKNWYCVLARTLPLGFSIFLLLMLYLNIYHYTQISYWQIIGGNMFRQFSDTLPVGIYLLGLPFVFFPWALWPPLYYSVFSHWRREGVLLCLTWFFTPLLLMIFIGASTITPIMPVYPALALIIAKTYHNKPLTLIDALPIAITTGLTGILLALTPFFATQHALPNWIGNVSPLWGIGLLLFTSIFLINIKQTRLQTLVLISIAIVIAFNFAIVRASRAFYDVQPAAIQVANLQEKNIAIAHQGRYLGHLHFLGKLQYPLYSLQRPQDLVQFQKTFPQGRVVAYVDEISLELRPYIEYWQPFRGRYLIILPVAFWQPPWVEPTE